MALTKWQPPVLRHRIDDAGKVVWLELYFDLIYVAALIQLGDKLSSDVSLRGVAEFLGIFALLWWTWTGTTAFMNRFAVDDIWHRILVFSQMFAVGNLALVAVSPIDDRSTWLVVAYVVARIPLMIMYTRLRGHGGATARLAGFYNTVFALGCVLWLASLAVPTPARFAVWGLAIAIEFAAPILAVGRVVAPPAHEEHFRERYALFTIIVLGEGFVKTLSELAAEGISIQSQVFGALVFLLGASLWWTYFDDVADSLIRPGRQLRQVTWVYAHLPLAAALTALGVASKKIVAIEGFGDPITESYLWLLVGSIATTLIATAVLAEVTVSPHFAIDRQLRLGPRLVAAAALLALPVVVGFEPAVVVVSLVAGVTLGQIGFEVCVATLGERRLKSKMAAELSGLDGNCQDLAAAEPQQVDDAVCEQCRAEGQTWVELRVCLTCGHVGCCDDTPSQHARAHRDETGHQAIATIEPGSNWAYCYEHDVLDSDWTELDSEWAIRGTT